MTTLAAGPRRVRVTARRSELVDVDAPLTRCDLDTVTDPVDGATLGALNVWRGIRRAIHPGHKRTDGRVASVHRRWQRMTAAAHPLNANTCEAARARAGAKDARYRPRASST